jgi:O-antigen/teichoic acid export membrane protein
LLAIAVIAGAAALGAVRAAMLLLGPLTVFFVAMFVISVPEVIRARERSPAALPRMVVILGAAMVLATGAWVGAVVLVPDSMGRALLGANWGPARHLLPAMALVTAAHGCALAAVAGLRALGAARESLRARLWGAPVLLLGAIVGATFAGAYGAGVGLAAGAWIDAILAWAAFRQMLRRAAVPVDVSTG